jgi:hypothetical protein
MEWNGENVLAITETKKATKHAEAVVVALAVKRLEPWTFRLKEARKNG